MRPTARLLLLVALASVVLTACDDGDLTREGRPASLAGTAWRVVAVNGRPPIAGSEPTAVFTADRVQGSGGCNSYGGHYTYDSSSGAITLLELAMTSMACVQPGRNEFETLFSQALSQASSASVDPQGRLVLDGPGGQIVLAIDAVPA